MSVLHKIVHFCGPLYTTSRRCLRSQHESCLRLEDKVWGAKKISDAFWSAHACNVGDSGLLLLLGLIFRVDPQNRFLEANMSTSDFYLRYYVGHKGKFGHEFLEFEFRPDGESCSAVSFG